MSPGLWHLVWAARADQDAIQPSSRPLSVLKAAGFLPLILAINFCRSDPALGLLLTQPAGSTTHFWGRSRSEAEPGTERVLSLAGSVRFWSSRPGRWSLMLPWRLEMRPDPSSGAEAVRPGEGQEGPDWEGGVSSPQPGICPGSQPREAIPDWGGAFRGSL